MSTEQALYDTIGMDDIITDGGTAATEDSSQVWVAPAAGRIVGAGIIQKGTVTANDTNYGTYSIKNGATVMAAASTTTTDLGSLTKDIAYPLTLSATPANLTFEAGDAISVAITKTGTGVVVNAPAWYITVAYGR